MKYVYIFDTNAFVNWYANYGPDIVDGMKEKMEIMIKEKRLFSVREVYREINEKTDLLSKWAKKHADIFLYPRQEVTEEMFYVMENYSGLINPFKSKPQSDPWIIAQAIVARKKDKSKNLRIVLNDAELGKALSNEGLFVFGLKKFMTEENIRLKVQ